MTPRSTSITRATTPVDPRVVDEDDPVADASTSATRRRAATPTAGKPKRRWRRRARRSRRWSTPTRKEIVWTSGATESDNLAIKGAAHFYKTQGQAPHHGEDRAQGGARHHARARAPGLRGDLPRRPEPDGLLDLDKLKAALRPDTILVSVMHVNNEIGVIQDIAAIGEICRAKGIIFHVDAAQATGKVADRPGEAAGRPDDRSRRTRPTAPRASARCTCAASRACASRRRCTAAATSAACARARCPRTRSSAWARPSASPGRKWRPRTSASACCATGCCDGLHGHRGGLRQRRPRAARAAQPQHQLQLRRGRVADHGASRTWRCRRARPAPRRAWSRPTCCARSGRSDELAHSSIRFTIGRFTTEEEIDYAVKLLKEKVAQAARAVARCGRCTRTASTSTRCSGRRIEQRMILARRHNMAYSDKVLDHYENPRNVGSLRQERRRASAPAWSARPPAATS